MTSTPYLSWNFCVMARGQAEPADNDFLQVRQLLAGFLQELQQHQPHGGHGGRDRHFFGVEQLVDALAVHLHARKHKTRTRHRCSQR